MYKKYNFVKNLFCYLFQHIASNDSRTPDLDKNCTMVMCSFFMQSSVIGCAVSICLSIWLSVGGLFNSPIWLTVPQSINDACDVINASSAITAHSRCYLGCNISQDIKCETLVSSNLELEHIIDANDVMHASLELQRLYVHVHVALQCFAIRDDDFPPFNF